MTLMVQLLRSTFALLVIALPGLKAEVTFCDAANSSDASEEIHPKQRIIGGRATSANHWPSQAIFYTYDAMGMGMMCGATIIDERWLLTAGHCVRNGYDQGYVTVGMTSISTYQKSIKITKRVLHPNYDEAAIHNDIALIKTSRKIPLGMSIRPVCLARDDRELLAKAKEGVITGFGLYIEDTTSPSSEPKTQTLSTSDVLRETRVPLIPQPSCRSQWKLLTAGTTLVTEKQLCAGSFLHGTAPGDSGGPLFVADDDGVYIQVGVTSFGADGSVGLLDQKTYPGVYTRVSAYAAWIESVVNAGVSPLQATPFLLFISHFLL